MKPSRNFWPYGIILTFVLFISGTVGLVVMACTHSTDLVNSNYYDQEIRYQARIDSENRAHAIGAAVGYDNLKHRIQISIPMVHGQKDITGTIQLYRPSAARMDQQLRLETSADGTQQIDAGKMPPGLWQIRVTWECDGQAYFLEQKIVIGAA